MDTEKLSYEEAALSQIADFGNGSMRDALSLLDQSISYGNGNVSSQDIKAMLGLVHHDDIIILAKHLFNQDAKAVIEFIKDLSHRGENLTNALKDLSSLFHQISLAQIIDTDNSEIKELAQQISNQDLQIFYQMAINGTKDMPLAPSEQIGFEMTLLRMLAFHSDVQELSEKKTLKIKPQAKSENTTTTKQTATEKPQIESPTPQATALDIANQTQWEVLTQDLTFNGGAQMLIKNTLFDSLNNSTITLTLDEQFANLLSDHVQKSILTTLRKTHPEINLIINLGQPISQTLAQKETQARDEHLAKIQQQFLNDAVVQKLEQTFNAKVNINSIKEITKH